MLTTEQRATLKAAIIANQTANTLFVDGDHQRHVPALGASPDARAAGEQPIRPANAVGRAC